MTYKKHKILHQYTTLGKIIIGLGIAVILIIIATVVAIMLLLK